MLIPKKSLGQNFLIDKNIAKKTVNLANNICEKNIIEVGPGKGALTDEIIIKNPKNIILIEKDKLLYEFLLNKYKNIKNIKVINHDALTYNYKIIPKPKTIISNLPYNISIKLIFSWLKTLSEFNEIIVMMQKEVAQKMQYKNIKKRNRLNVITELSSNFNIEFNRDWNLPTQATSVNGLTLGTGGFNYSTTQLGNYNYQFEHLNYANNYAGSRHTVHAAINRKKINYLEISA